ncbi:MAG: SH3 domain-containing protein [Anaerolineales bacterium]
MSRPNDGCLLRLAGAALGILVAVIVLIAARLGGTSASRSGPPPILTVIPIPTSGPLSTASPEPTPSPAPPESAPPDQQSAKQFTVGDLVEVYGTQGDGLRIRESPGLEAPILILGLESEVFQIVEGPVVSDGLSWWRISNLYDPSETGWAADSFLRSLEP